MYGGMCTRVTLQILLQKTVDSCYIVLEILYWYPTTKNIMV